MGSILVVDDDDYDYDDGDGGSGGGGAARDRRNPTFSSTKFASLSSTKFASPASNFFLPPPQTIGARHDDDDDDVDVSGDGGNSSPPPTNAARACLLAELNPDVVGRHLAVPSLEGLDYESLLANIIVAGVDEARTVLVVSADQPPAVFLPLSRACLRRSMPLIVVRSYGLIGYVRVQARTPYHPVIDARPSHRVPDLRLSSQLIFDGLAGLLKSSTDLDDVSDARDRSHAPFVIVLLQALER